jgi:hypothetical protein
MVFHGAKAQKSPMFLAKSAASCSRTSHNLGSIGHRFVTENDVYA